MKRILFSLLLLFSVTGCSGREVSEAEEASGETVPVFITDYESGFRIFREEEVFSQLYEPDEGCYAGAYILSDKAVGGIAEFERITGKEHAFYTYYLKMGQPFPTEWVLDCIAKMKTPNIVLVPENADNPFDTKLIEETAKKFGEFYVPMFVHFYPVKSGLYTSGEDYISFFKTARVYFSRYASNAAFVWDISAEDLDMINDFYPGDESVDWAGINLFSSGERGNDDLALEDLTAKLDYFYYTFQQKKPVFISELAISHFSSKEHAYTVNEASGVMEGFFTQIAENYPRVKAVNYMSYNSIEPVNMKQDIYNYSVADNSKMTAVYKKSVEGEFFLSEIKAYSGGEMITQKVASPFYALYYDNAFYGDKRLIGEIGAKNISDENAIIIEKENYYPIEPYLSGKQILKGNLSKRTVEILR
ncbi:hypothetical protein LJB89_04390 [Tyzzerella sp. OttesenSCG-928-J15]|nr:hypothetical protein [Tyzzerella sp. OttesenSCG-928-J15]